MRDELKALRAEVERLRAEVEPQKSTAPVSTRRRGLRHRETEPGQHVPSGWPRRTLPILVAA